MRSTPPRGWDYPMPLCTAVPDEKRNGAASGYSEASLGRRSLCAQQSPPSGPVSFAPGGSTSVQEPSNVAPATEQARPEFHIQDFLAGDVIYLEGVQILAEVQQAITWQTISWLVDDLILDYGFISSLESIVMDPDRERVRKKSRLGAWMQPTERCMRGSFLCFDGLIDIVRHQDVMKNRAWY